MNKQKTVVIGLSGGVDSSVSALLLKKQGYNVIGAFMKNFSDTKNPFTGECSYLEDKKMAQKIAAILNIQLVIFDFEKEYKRQVIGQIYKDYASGLTPNPDIYCNSIIKFPLFWKKAKTLGADYIAMGHYARIKKTKLGYELLQGKDKTKDQSYFLADLSQKDFEHTLFPLENLKKEEVRKIAKENNFPNWDKKGTRGICFVGKTNMQQFLKKKIKPKKGMIISHENKVIGTHPGIMYYTIGQRIGPSLGFKIKKEFGNRKWYIADKRKDNSIIVAPENHKLLERKEIVIKKLHLINPKEKIPNKLKARIRHLGEMHSGRLEKNSGKHLFKFRRPVKSIAEGQFIVIYSKNKVVCSGEIRFK